MIFILEDFYIIISHEKKTATRVGKKVKKAPQPKKAPKSPEFIEKDDSGEEEENPPKDNNGEKIPPYWR